jgi:hypothetical protein
MIISENIRPPREDFDKLLQKLDSALQVKSKKNPHDFIGCNPTEFEGNFVFKTLEEVAKDTPFNGSIRLISGHKFPDIIVKNIYGIEVKTTKADKWTSTGNSVFESTRVEDVEKIYIFFAKLINPIGFRYKPYQECLHDIAVTHSPRYLIDMDLKKGDTIFDKMGVDYEKLRMQANPVATFREYYKRTNPREEPWWMGNPEDSEEPHLVNPVVKLFSDLTTEEKSSYVIRAMVFFPEIFGNYDDKYKGVASWLAGRYGVVDSCLRDRFTAGGRKTIQLGKNNYKNIPRIFKTLVDKMGDVRDLLLSTDSSELDYYWGEKNPHDTNLNRWSKLFLRHSKGVINDNQKFLINLIGYQYPGEKPPFIKEAWDRYHL